MNKILLDTNAYRRFNNVGKVGEEKVNAIALSRSLAKFPPLYC
ncbi:hypothetical protein ACYULU_05750 [Breznakiellaceae bacterium SP9]